MERETQTEIWARTEELDFALSAVASMLGEESRQLFSRRDLHDIADELLDRRNELNA